MSNRAAIPKDFARQLLAYRMASAKTAGEKDSAVFRICEELRGPLGKLLGVAGFRSILSRALALAGAEAPWLRALRIQEDASLEGVEEEEAKLDRRAVIEGELILVGHLLGLLVIFIGPALTLEVLHEIWPDWTIETSETEKRHAEK